MRCALDSYWVLNRFIEFKGRRKEFAISELALSNVLVIAVHTNRYWFLI